MAFAEQAREDEFRTCVARLVQIMRHHLPARDLPAELAPLVGLVRRLAALLDAGALTEHLREAACAVVDVYQWPNPPGGSADDGLAMDPVVLAAVERLRGALDAMDAENGDAGE